MKKAIITGISGQDGSLMAEYLLMLGYNVIGTIHNEKSIANKNSRNIVGKVRYVIGDLTDAQDIAVLIRDEQPDEIYNFAAMANSVKARQYPKETMIVNGYAVEKILDAICNYAPNVRLFQASSSEVFGDNPIEIPQNEETPFCPCNPYALSKVYAQEKITQYRDAKGLFVCSGIFYNHESERRNKNFLTHKVLEAILDIHKKQTPLLTIGNLDAKKDWGYAREYIKAAHLALQCKNPNDYIIATGQLHTVREFIETAFKVIGISLKWEGSECNEIGRDAKTDALLIQVSAEYYREDNGSLVGNPQKIKVKTGWENTLSFSKMIEFIVKDAVCYGLL